MNKPQRQTYIDELNWPELHNKRNDILYCIESAKSVDAMEAYENQLDYIQKVIATRKDLYEITTFIDKNRSNLFTIEKYKDWREIKAEWRTGHVKGIEGVKKYLLTILPVDDELYKQLASNINQWG